MDSDVETNLMEVLRLARGNGDDAAEAEALVALADYWWRQGRFGEALDYGERGLEISRRLGDRKGEARALTVLGAAHGMSGDGLSAVSLFEQSLAVGHEVGDREGVAISLGNLANVHRTAGRIDEALAAVRESAKIFHEVGIPDREAIALMTFGGLLMDSGALDEASSVLARALALARAGDNEFVETGVLYILGSIAARQHRDEDAIETFELAFSLAKRQDDSQGAERIGRALATMYLRMGEGEAAQPVDIPLPSVGGLTVGGLVYAVGARGVWATWVAPDGAEHHTRLAGIEDVLPRIEALREELADPMAVARGRVPRLREFVEDWGLTLVPAPMLENPPDVVVVVPHALLHDLPLHLVAAGDSTRPLGCEVGVSYVSSRSLFHRCVERNPARSARLAEWQFREGGFDLPRYEGHFVGGGADVLSSGPDAFRHLPRSLAALFDTSRTTLLDETHLGFTRSGVKFAVGRDPDVLCLVAHGHVNADDHRFSGLLLPQERVMTRRAQNLHGDRLFEFRDLPFTPIGVTVPTTRPAEVLTAAELEVDVQVHTELVLLLACSAGSGRVFQGDAPGSVAETFLHIGAPSVLAPAWDTEYDFTFRWMTHFWRAWQRLRQPKALAYRYAMRKMHEETGGASPERVGALVLRGDWL